MPDPLWRLVRFPLVLMLLEIVAVGGTMLLGSTVLHALHLGRDHPLEPLGALAVAAAVALVFAACRRWLEGEPPGEFALAAAPRELALGLAAGFLLFTTMAALVAALGGLTVIGVGHWPGDFASVLAMAVISGTFEETMFRGVLFRHAETLLGSWGALAFTAALFGIAHRLNPDSTWFAALAITLEAGILLGAAFMVTRRLWVPIGLHAAWNFTQGWVFSAPVSGGRAPLGLLLTRRVGPDWLTGGAFGLEASAVAMAVATAAGLAMAWAAVRRARVRPPRWLHTNE